MSKRQNTTVFLQTQKYLRHPILHVEKYLACCEFLQAVLYRRHRNRQAFIEHTLQMITAKSKCPILKTLYPMKSDGLGQFTKLWGPEHIFEM